MDTFLVYPDEKNSYPLVVFLMDAPGKRKELHDMAIRIASSGYYVLLPDLYYRVAPGFVTDFTEKSMEIMFSHMNSLSYKMIISDFKFLIDFAKNDIHCKHNIVGTVGYCMSGPFAFRIAAEFAEIIKCSASIHGVALYSDKEDSPHLFANKISGEMYFACAEIDSYAPTEMITNLDNYLSKLDINYELDIYPNTGHGFVFPERKKIFNKEAAEKHWEKLLDLFHRNLKNNN